ncbi:MAG: sugar MFS transporter [Bacteroidetes bacterium]|nr:sugar MFS transporter [Bacteroidota bacterium]
MGSSNSNTTQTANSRPNYQPALVLLTSLFFIWGFITCLNDILIPHLKGLFELNYTNVMLIQSMFFGAYFLMSLPSGWIVGRIGYKKGIVLGLSITGLGALLFYPASIIISYPFFLFSLFILASGLTLLQVAANPYVAILGRPETASSRLSLTQAFNSLGTTIAPLFGSYLILNNSFTTPVEEAQSVQGPYLGIFVVLFIIAAIFIFAKLPTVQSSTYKKGAGSAWAYKHLVLGAIAIFVYVGAEVSIGSFLINYLSMEKIANITEAEAAFYITFYWGGAMVGRFIGSAVMQKIKAQKVLSFNALIAIILLIVTMSFVGNIAMWAVLLVGLFNSIMFPTIFTLSIDGLGEHTSQGSGILCMAIVGGAILPLLMGYVTDLMGGDIQKAYIIPIVCYVYILLYGLKWYKKIIPSGT